MGKVAGATLLKPTHGTARRETEPSGPIQSVIPPRSPSSLRSFHSLNRKRRLDFPRFFSLFGVRMTIDISVLESWKFVFAFCPFDLISVSLAYLFVVIEAPQTKCTNLSNTAIVREKSYWRIILYYNLGQQHCVWWWGIRSSPIFLTRGKPGQFCGCGKIQNKSNKTERVS